MADHQMDQKVASVIRAGRLIVGSWDKGDLAGAVRQMDRALADLDSCQAKVSRANRLLSEVLADCEADPAMLELLRPDLERLASLVVASHLSTAPQRF